MTRTCPHVPGFACPIMPGLECPELPYHTRPGVEAKAAYCGMEAMAAGLTVQGLGGSPPKYDRKAPRRPPPGLVR